MQVKDNRKCSFLLTLILSFLATQSSAQQGSGVITRTRGGSSGALPRRYPIRSQTEGVNSPQSIAALQQALILNRQQQEIEAYSANTLTPKMRQLVAEEKRLSNALYGDAAKRFYPDSNIPSQAVSDLDSTDTSAVPGSSGSGPARFKKRYVQQSAVDDIINVQPYVKPPGAETYKQYIKNGGSWKPPSSIQSVPGGIDPYSDPRRVYKPFSVFNPETSGLPAQKRP